MRNRQSGFTLLELIIVMAIMMIVIMSASEMFVSLLTEFKQQGKIAVTNIEGILGLEMFRRDIEHAGYGLPWDGLTGLGYTEIAGGPSEAVDLNDVPPNAPRAILSRDNKGWKGTDRLAIKASNVALSNTCEKWTLIDKANLYTKWTSTTEKLKDKDYIMVISQGPASRTLVPLKAGGFSTTFDNPTAFDANRSDTAIVYGIDPKTIPKMPFNRADYYVADPVPPASLPTHCAAGTGQLYKAVISQNSDAFDPIVPILDCVADMQVVFRRDTTGNGNADNWAMDIIGSNAEQIRTQVREVRVYILAQEGQRDKSYTHPNQVICVGEQAGPDCLYGRPFDFQDSNHPIPDWKNYRWKLYTLVVKPVNLK